MVSYADLYESLWLSLNPNNLKSVSKWTDSEVKQIEILLDTFPQEHRKAFDGYFMSPDQSMIRLVGFAPDVAPGLHDTETVSVAFAVV